MKRKFTNMMMKWCALGIFQIIIFSISLVVADQDHGHQSIIPLRQSDAIQNNFAISNLKRYEIEQPINYCDNSSSIDDFPEDLFTNEQRKHGALVLHFIAAAYFFTLLAVVCNDYFLPSVECICEDLHIPKDVAAATFMATATTMPEFFTNIISTFVTESDIGLGTIIGSLMFNTLGVAAVSSIAATKPVQLDWWPITRDCILYVFNLILLIIFAWDGVITLHETIIMVVIFFAYYVVLFQNQRVQPAVKWFLEDYMNCCRVSSYELPVSYIEKNLRNTVVTLQPTSTAKTDSPKSPQGSISISSINNDPIFMIYNKGKIYESETDDGIKKKRKSLWRIPVSDKLKTIWWAYTWPIKFILTMTVPNPKTFRRLYPLTFIMCIIWIGLNAYMIVWMISVMGYTLSIPDAVMGLTFLAAGGCMPEGISSFLMIRKNEGGVGVSNSLGANSLNILMSLGIPWMIRNILNRGIPGKDSMKITSEGIGYLIALLLISVVSLYVILTISRYRLKKTVGMTLMMVYLVIITLGICIEMNLFFPSSCV